ncbi:MAG: CBS domain-containing protein [Kofleriaceae bacterium]|nr:CBS domain-containing protein [Kofleriaceae bacterium]
MEQATVPATGTIRDAMLALERGSLAIALVVDHGRLVGLLTDGDIRRALLRGAAVTDCVADHMQRNFVSVGAHAQRAEVIELMQARYIQQIPVVDADGRLTGLHLLRDVIGVPKRENWAVIMAGGRGTRLAPLTDLLPKPMLRVAGRPILERIVLHLVGQGVRRIYLAINYLGHIIRDHFGDGSRFGARIEYLSEEQALGTGGALSLLPEPPTSPVLVMNGDLVTQADVGALLAFHEAGGQKATVAVRKYFHTVPFGCVELDGERLVRLEEKPTLTRLVNAGIYVLAPELVTALPRNTPIGLPDILGDAMNRGQDVRAFEIDDDWIDVGQRDQLSQARGDS